MPGERGADFRVQTVGRNDHVGIGKALEASVHLAFEMEADAELPSPILQDRQQVLASDTAETMAGRCLGLTPKVDIDIIPMRQIGCDGRCTDRIIILEIAHGLIGEDHPPAKGVTRTIAFIDIDLGIRVTQLHRDREIETGWPPSQTGNLHRTALHASEKLVYT